MKSNRSNEYVLGVMVSGRTLFGSLLDLSGAEPRVVMHLVRHRISRSVTQQPSMMGAGADPTDASGNDFTLQFGEGGASNQELFLQSEFAAGGDRRMGAEHVAQTASFEFELSEMLDECAQAGYAKPSVVFCAQNAEISHIEVRVPEKPRKGKAKATTARKVAPEELMELLAAQFQGELDKERVAFVPMTPSDDGEQRFLGLAAKVAEPVARTLQVLRRQKDEPMPTVRLLDAETTVYLGLARMAGRTAGVGAGGGHVLVVRAGAEDTLVMFVKGEQLRHFDSMRSLTAYDSPETICSRVLLQQDEYGIDDVQDILVLSEGRELDLLDSLRMFFPDARVESLSVFAPQVENTDGKPYAAQQVVAAAVAMRMMRAPNVRTAFPEVNLLPKRYLRRKIELPFTIPTMVLGVLIFATAFFFAGRFVMMQSEIGDYRQKLQQYPPMLGASDPKVLQARIDSLHAAHQAYTHALGVMDTLLVGSDLWSRALDQVSREAARLPGLWIEGWHPTETDVEVTGNATSRERVIQLAERMGADVQALTFTEIREASLYAFTMRLPLRSELPLAAVYLREQAMARITAERQAAAEARP